MSHVVEVYGGPLHGMKVALPDGVQHLHIAGLEDLKGFYQDTDDEVPEVPYRKGVYSPVSGVRDVVEWDGWGTDD